MTEIIYGGLRPHADRANQTAHHRRALTIDPSCLSKPFHPKAPAFAQNAVAIDRLTLDSNVGSPGLNLEQGGPNRGFFIRVQELRLSPFRRHCLADDDRIAIVAAGNP